MYSESVEIRWFKKGGIPKKVKDWYTSYGPWLEQAARKDYYHCQLAGGKLGTKLREEMIEVKQFLEQAGALACGNGKIRGTLERWRKWSFKLSEEKEVMPVVENSGDWIAIEKQRWLRQYAVSGQQITVLEPGQTANQGCTVEVSEVHYNKVKWWSLCFEAFGQKDGLTSAVRLAAHELIPFKAPFDFRQDEGSSYPEWLEKINHK